MRIILSAILLVVALCGMADSYKILWLNSDKIVINGAPATRNMTFNDYDAIEWSSEIEGIEAINTSSARRVSITAANYQKNKSKSLGDYLSKIERLSTREMGTIDTDTTFYFIHEMELESGLTEKDNLKVYAVKVQPEEEAAPQSVELTLSPDGKIIVTAEALSAISAALPVDVDILGYEPTRDWHFFIYRNLHLYPLPESLESPNPNTSISKHEE